MSQREGHAPGGAIAPTSPNDGPTAVPGSARQSATPKTFVEAAPSLPLQLREGTVEPGGPKHIHASMDVVRPFLQKALAGGLPPVEIADPVEAIDAALDEVQRDAVDRALKIDELFVIQGPAGTGKTRVAVEVVRQAIKRGGRVLFLSPESKALDARLASFVADTAVQRRIGSDESVERLPKEVAALTSSLRRTQLRTRIEQRAARMLFESGEKLRLLQGLRPTCEKFRSLRDQQCQRRTSQDARIVRKSSLADEVRREAESTIDSAPYYVQRLRQADAAHARRLATFDTAAAELRTQRQAVEAELHSAEAACQSLRPKANALEHSRWYTLTFWKARSEGTVVERLSQVENKLAIVRANLEELAVREQKLASDRSLADEEHAAERARYIDGEVQRREAELMQSIEQAQREIEKEDRIESELQATIVKAGIYPAALEAELEKASHAHALARDVATDTAARLDELVEEATRQIDVVAGPIAGIADDVETAALGPFDTLVIDDAHRLTESDFVAAARLAKRWILIGGPVEVAPGRGRFTRQELFARLTMALRHDVWVEDGSSLVCRLYPVRGAERRHLECEPVADAPEIELRLYNPPSGEPTLAEVAFPNTTQPSIAREYLFREMGEVTCQPRRRTVHWESGDEGLVARFGSIDSAGGLAEIGAGIHEELVGLETRAIRFGPTWTLDRAKSWLAEHVGRRESGRIVMLSKPQRACPGLARWLNRAFGIGFSVPDAIDDVAHVEFLAVPDTDSRRRHEPRQHTNGRVGGAGYEIDLADPRRRAALPAEFADLPASGVVNVPEAQALVRYLEQLSQGANVAVTSPFPAQITLLRRLITRSSRLAGVKVLDIADAAQHETDLLVVSLTRSHVARAVTFGDGPGVLAGLLGRARKKVLFAGDPGTLARRLQWEGPVDHLDANDAARERGWVAALADCPRVAHPRHRSMAEAAR